MNISVKKALGFFGSERFNKINFLIFFIIVEICLIPGDLIPEQTLKNNIGLILLLGCLSIIGGVLNSGINALTTNNIVKGKKNVLPGIGDILQIITTGLKCSIGNFVLFLITIIPICFLFGIFLGIFSAKMQLIPTIITGIIMILFYIHIIFKVIIPLNLMFLQTLKFDSFFAFKHIKSFLEKRKQFWKYIGGCIVISIIGIILPLIILSIIFGIVFVILHGAPAPAQLSALKTILGTLLFLCVYITLWSMLANYSAQYIRSGMKPKNKIPSETKEYMHSVDETGYNKDI